MPPNDLPASVGNAVAHFWHVRIDQARRQGGTTGRRDAGARSAVTGGRQMDGFVGLVRGLLRENGVPEAAVHTKKRVELPGWFRPEKCWDLVLVIDGRLVAAIEFKSQVGPSFGNNYNIRTEEALGSATDLWGSYREGAIGPSPRPWLGYLMLLEESPQSTKPVRAVEPHFRVFPEFRDASYARRYEILLTKLLRDRLYDGACLLLSSATNGVDGAFREPAAELSFRCFAESLIARAIAATRWGP
jgi:hypothetical protein